MSKCQLIQGDCLEEMDKLIDEGVKVDMVLTDPPYGTTACKWDSIIPFDKMWSRLKELVNINSPILLFGSEPFSSCLRISNLPLFKYDWIWDKVQGKQPYLAKIQPMKNHEIISVFGEGKLNYTPQIYKGKPYSDRRGGQIVDTEHFTEFKRQNYENKNWRYPVSILTYINPNHKGMHPTEKPVPLLEYLIKTYTNENDTVLDFTMGSGSTGVACLQTNRNFIGIELDENYYNIAKKRCSEYQSKLW